MKNLYSKNEFLNTKTNNYSINEGLFNFLGNLFNKISTYIKKVNGGAEIEQIYHKYLAKIDNDIKTKIQVDLSLSAEEQLNKNKQQVKVNTNAPTNSGNTNVSVPTNSGNTNVSTNSGNTNETIRVYLRDNINEATEAETNVKLTLQALKDKGKLIQQIIDTNVENAKNEMNRVLAKYGGAEKNLKLSIIIANKIDEFKLAYLNAKVKIYNAGGDKTQAVAVAKDRDALSKKLDEKWSNLSKQTQQKIEYKVGDTVKFKSDSLGKDVEDKIIKVDGDTLTFNGKNGEYTKKISDVSKVQQTTTQQTTNTTTTQQTTTPVSSPSATEFKVGDRISWTPDGATQEITRTVTKVDGDILSFKEGDKQDGKEQTKKSSNVKKVEAKNAATQVEQQK